MAFVASDVTTSGLERSWSLGPVKTQVMTWTAASGDTSGTITVKGLTTIFHLQLTGCTQTALPTYSGNVATVAFADPVATVFGQIIALGV